MQFRKIGEYLNRMKFDNSRLIYNCKQNKKASHPISGIGDKLKVAMALVNYSSSSESISSLSDIEDKIETKIKQCNKNQKINEKRKLPIPSFLKKSVAKPTEDFEIDSPDKHDGKIRSFQHERGNWASFVYIKVSLDFEELQNEIQTTFKNFVDLKQSKDIHISVTKTLILRHHWIDTFSESILKLFKELSSFQIRFDSLNVYTNEEKTRTFIGLTVERLFSANLKNITDNIDQILDEFGLEKFYSEPLYHASIIWCVGNHMDFFQSKKGELRENLNKFCERHPYGLVMNVEDIDIKIGNKFYTCNLKS